MSRHWLNLLLYICNVVTSRQCRDDVVTLGKLLKLGVATFLLMS